MRAVAEVRRAPRSVDCSDAPWRASSAASAPEVLQADATVEAPRVKRARRRYEAALAEHHAPSAAVAWGEAPRPTFPRLLEAYWCLISSGDVSPAPRAEPAEVRCPPLSPSGETDDSEAEI